MTDQKFPVPRLIYGISFFLCAAGSLAIVLFAFGLERNNTWADKLLKNLLQHHFAIIVSLVIFCLLVCLPLLFKNKKCGSSDRILHSTNVAIYDNLILFLNFSTLIFNQTQQILKVLIAHLADICNDHSDVNCVIVRRNFEA